MTFSYSSSLTTTLDWVRFHVGDSIVSPKGIRPDGGNFSNEEITAMLAMYPLQPARVVGELFGILETEWTRYAVDYAIGPRREDLSKIAEGYGKKRKEWLVTAGVSGYAFSSGTRRPTTNDNAGVT